MRFLDGMCTWYRSVEESRYSFFWLIVYGRGLRTGKGLYDKTYIAGKGVCVVIDSQVTWWVTRLRGWILHVIHKSMSRSRQQSNNIRVHGRHRDSRDKSYVLKHKGECKISS